MACIQLSPKSNVTPIAPPPNHIERFDHEWKNWLHDLWNNQNDLLARVTLLEIGDYDPNGFQTISDVSTATGLTVPASSTKCLIQADGEAVNWRDDGTSPTVGAGGGFTLQAGDSMLYVADLDAIELIEAASGVTARVNIVYYI